MRPLTPGETEDVTAVHDCWNSIGVRGDRSCPALQTHSHCRNCPAYAAAASALLDRAIPAGSLAERTEHFRRAKPSAAAETHSAIMFRVGSEWFALSTLVLDEVIDLRAIHSLPHRQSPIVLGLVNVRGELVVCVSIARLLGGEATAPGKQGRLLVVRHESGRLAFPVDEVQHMLRYAAGALQPPPATIALSGSSFTKGLLRRDDRIVNCLDEQRTLLAMSRSLA